MKKCSYTVIKNHQYLLGDELFAHLIVFLYDNNMKYWIYVNIFIIRKIKKNSK